MHSRLVNRIQHSLYNFARPPKTGNFLPLYQSAVFKSTLCSTQPNSLKTSLTKKQQPHVTNNSFPLCSQVYSSLTQQSGLYPSRYLYTSLGFDPENEVFRIVTLRAGGYLVQEFGAQCLIPWSYRGNQSSKQTCALSQNCLNHDTLFSWTTR